MSKSGSFILIGLGIIILQFLQNSWIPLNTENARAFAEEVSGPSAELGDNDFRISDMGPNGDLNFQPMGIPAVAYNSTNNEYLIVWVSDDNTSPLINGEIEVFGQRINAATGAEVGTNDFRISDMGTNGDVFFGVTSVAVVYNPTNNEYLVIWAGDDNTSPLVNGELEIFGQRLNASNGAEIGTNDFRISDMGTNGSVSFGANFPQVAFNSTDNEYLVVWQGDDNTPPLVDNELEIFGQRLNATTGNEIGTNDFRISDMGSNGDTNFGASFPDVAYSTFLNQYAIVWRGDDNTGSLVNNEFEVFLQRLTSSGVETGTNDQRISVMGVDGDVSFQADSPAISFSSDFSHEYLIVWSGEDSINGENEIYGLRVSDGGTFRRFGISD
ncbi:MAG: hypothetical protein HC806_06605 [Anaerolineae bacterium]|nr:hypothetical protein [Anaerolineae bacterium]